jgi:hypothetical protein
MAVSRRSILLILFLSGALVVAVSLAASGDEADRKVPPCPMIASVRAAAADDISAYAVFKTVKDDFAVGMPYAPARVDAALLALWRLPNIEWAEISVEETRQGVHVRISVALASGPPGINLRGTADYAIDRALPPWTGFYVPVGHVGRAPARFAGVQFVQQGEDEGVCVGFRTVDLLGAKVEYRIADGAETAVREEER